MTTLLTIIGRGNLTSGGEAYQPTAYQFPGGSHTSVFFGAALAAELAPTAIHLVGTRTSTWQALALDVLQDLDLATHLEAKQRTGPTLANLGVLAKGLSAAWSADTTCTMLPIDQAPDAAECTMVALHLYRLLPGRGPLILDLTHGFRTLPMLAMAALHLHDAFHPGSMARTTFWYGELATPAGSAATPARPGPAIATGRALRLDGLRSISRLAQAAAALTVGLNPEPLAALVRATSRPLAEALDDLGEGLLAHDFTVLTKAPEQILTHLDRLDGDLDGLVANEIRAVVAPLAKGPLSQRLVALATLAQAVGRPALAALAAYEGLGRLATRDAQTADVDAAVAAFLAGKPEAAAVCDRLRRVRNRVAHGAQTVRSDREPLGPALDAALPVLRRLLG